MGCETSSGIEPSQARFSPLVRNLSTQRKSQIISAIQDDNLADLAVILQEAGGNPNSQISDQGMKWMLNHLCCRWDADNCLQYLLKQYFAENPRAYVDYVNAMTFQGFTPLHLCANWKAEKCFRVLHYYGGLNLAVKDKMYKTPYESAVENRCSEMAACLKQYNDIQVKFTNIEVQKLMGGDIISQQIKKTSDKKGPEFKLDPSLYKVAADLFSNINEATKQKEKRKKQLENEKQRLLQQRLKIMQEVDKQKKKFEEMKNQQTDYTSQIEDLEKEREKKQNQLQEEVLKKEQQMKKIYQEEKKAAEEQALKRRDQQMRKAEQAQLNKQEQLKSRLSDKLNTLSAFQKMRNTKKAQQPVEPQQMKESKHKPSSRNDKIPSQIMKIYEDVKASGKKFEDPQFPAVNATLGDRSKAESKGLLNNTVWLRPNEIFKNKQYVLFDGIDPNDIKQGSLGVCYMLATISALAKDPKNIENIFAFHDIDAGFYVLRLYINGKIKYMPIDDLIPCGKLTKSPLFTKPIGNQIWVLLLEKAWAKAVGDYLSAEAMTPDHIMEDLCGAPGHGAWFMKDKEKSTTQKTSQVIKHLKMKHIVVLTSGQDKLEGIAANHAYSCLDVIQSNGRYLFKIRNPWGRFQWNGQYGENSALWTQELKKKAGFEKKDDGVFFLTEDQLIKAFVYYSISEIKHNYCYQYDEFTTGEQQNVFYKFKVHAKAEINIRVTQLFKRMVKDQDYDHSPLIFEVGKIQSDGKVTFLSQGHSRAYWGSKSVHAFEQIMKQLDAGQYFVRIKMLWKSPSKYNSAVIASYGPTPIKLQRLSKQQGQSYAQQLLIGFGSSKNRTASGNIFYKIMTMRGQFSFIAQTDQPEEYTVKFIFNTSKLQKCVLQYGKINDTTLQVTVSKGKPRVATARRTQPASGGTTGPVNIQAVKKG